MRTAGRVASGRQDQVGFADQTMDIAAPNGKAPEQQPANGTSEITLSEFRETHKDHDPDPTGPQPVAAAAAEAPRRSSTWWLWDRQGSSAEMEAQDPAGGETADDATPDGPGPAKSTAEEPPANTGSIVDTLPTEDRRESWVDWANPVPRMNSIVSYIYAPQTVNGAALTPQADPNQLGCDHANSDAPISRVPSSHSSYQRPVQSEGIVAWLLPWWSARQATTANEISDSTDSMYSSKDSEELAKDAQRAIESSTIENKTSSWAFWSNSKSKNGELAVTGTGSEYHPARMNNLPTAYSENQEQQLKASAQPSSSAQQSLVIPNFDEFSRRASLRNRTRILLSSSKLLRETLKVKRQTHLYRSVKPKVIRKAVVIGIHGFFPIKMVRTLIGHPTGTSMKFATKATEALAKWASDNGIDIEIETIALEGEGKIIDRVGNLVKLLENWQDMIQEADFIYIASHSQGVMVSLHLVAELINRNLVIPRKTKIAMLNMCGVCNGPIVGLDSKLIVKAYSKFENEILMELFDFQDMSSFQSRKLLQSMSVLVANHVKMTFIGSVNDQLSPLYSSLFSVVNHPNIMRSIYVDKNTTEEIPDFLVKLVQACAISLNAGYSDSDLLFELSKYSSGSLTNGGHSRVYEDDQVYTLGIRNALETDELVLQRAPILQVSNKAFNAKSINRNPYHLPWCLRGFLDQLISIKNLDGEKLRQELLQSCETWKPQSKVHKELKYSVEVICQTY